MESNNQIIIYQTEDGQTKVDVRMENDMIWLTRQQIAILFGRDYKTISKHINNALKEELAGSVVVAKFANTTQHGAIEGKTQTHEIDYFNLEVITSVGYRVKSKRGVQFRQWANNVLKQYLIKGYAVNERIRKEQIVELRQLVGMLGRTIQSQPLLSNDEANALFEVVTDYTSGLLSTRPQRKSPSTLLTRMQWGPSMDCAKSLVGPLYLEKRKTNLSKAVLDRYTKLLTGKNYIPA